VWNLLHFTLLAPKILSWLQDFRNVCVILLYTVTLHGNLACNIYTYSSDRKRLRLGVESERVEYILLEIKLRNGLDRNWSEQIPLCW
jgi:hypothetical protein